MKKMLVGLFSLLVLCTVLAFPVRAQDDQDPTEQSWQKIVKSADAGISADVAIIISNPMDCPDCIVITKPSTDCPECIVSDKAPKLTDLSVGRTLWVGCSNLSLVTSTIYKDEITELKTDIPLYSLRNYWRTYRI